MKMSGIACSNIAITENQHEKAVANEFIVLGFAVCFFVAVICVIAFVRYVARQLSVERERERDTNRRKTLRIQTAKRITDVVDEDQNSSETLPLDTNYLSSTTTEMAEKVDLTEERSHSRITLMIEDVNYSDSGLSGSDPLTTLATLFTSSRNSLPPTTTNHCFDFMQTCFEQILSFHRETFSALLHLMLSILFEEKRINEIEKLQIVARYEQLLDEPVKANDIIGFTNKLHFVLAKLENEINSMIALDDDSHDKAFNGKKLSKYMMVIQRELSAYDCNEIVKEMFSVREYGLSSAIMDKWFHLEVIRYRISVINDAVEKVLEKSTGNCHVIRTVLGNYIGDVCQSLETFCQDFEKDLFDLVDKVKKDTESQSKQAFIELEMARLEQRSKEIGGMDISNRKLISKFVVAQIDYILKDLKTFTNYKLILQTENLDIFADFQKAKEKGITKLLKKCEEQLFDALQDNDIMDGDSIVSLGKTLSTSLKDFKTAQQQLKIEKLQKIKDSITSVSDIAKATYQLTQNKIEKGIEDIKIECVEALHSLSNLTEQEMNQLEHEFEVAFSSLAFSFQFSIMSGFVTSVHNTLSMNLNESNYKDLSFSLNDMVNILKQDKTVLKRPSLFEPLDSSFYVSVETQFCKILELKSSHIDDQLNSMAATINRFIIPKIDSVLQHTSTRQLKSYLNNHCIAKEKLLAASINSKGYTSSSASVFTKNCFEFVLNIWESQANFKLHKLKEETDSTMKDFDPIFKTFFSHNDSYKHFDKRFQELRTCLDNELSFFGHLEREVRRNSVERVIDANLENEIMIAKFENRLEGLESRGDDESSGTKKKNLGSRRSNLVEGKSMLSGKQSLRHSISRKKKN